MATSKQTELSKQNQSINLNSPAELVSYANELKQLIVENKMFTNIKGKNYVNVEGWQTALAFTGIYPIVESTENLSNDKEIKYRATVSLWQPFKGSNEPVNVGQAFATCSNKEHGKQKFDEYAVESMAQTRALGKAGRMKLGWLLKIAGYETTPAEEMVSVNVENVETIKEEPKVEVVNDFEERQVLITKINNKCKDLKVMGVDDKIVIETKRNCLADDRKELNKELLNIDELKKIEKELDVLHTLKVTETKERK